MSLWAVLLTGLFAGGASCAAVQGGLLAGVVARRRPDPAPTLNPRGGRQPATPRNPMDDVIPVAGFLAGKFVSHVALGAALGAALGTLGGAVDLASVPGRSSRSPPGWPPVGVLRPGRHRFTCAMGMYGGTIEVTP